MSDSASTQALKKRKAESSSSSTSDKQKTEPERLSEVYVVLACDYPLENDKWGHDSGHETQDTEILAVFANVAAANKFAKDEVREIDDQFESDDEDGGNDDASLFHWQEEECHEWTARRVWVEKKKFYYKY
jgi:hypothetical protein